MPTRSIAVDVNRPFQSAIDYAKSRGVVLPSEFYGELIGAEKLGAFSIAGVARIDQLKQVLDSLNDSLASGESFAKWKKKVASGEIALDLPRDRLDNIFRTNIQQAYGQGRNKALLGNTRARPFFMYDAINDSRTRPAHHAMDNYIARFDDPIWSSWTPPCGYRCRCTLIGLTEAQAVARGFGKMQNPGVEPDEGWDYDRLHGPDPITGDQIEDLRLERAAELPAPIKAAAEALAPRAQGLAHEMEVRTADDLQDMLRVWSERDASSLGCDPIHTIEVRSSLGEMAATNGRGLIAISDQTDPETGFNMLSQTMGAMGSIRNRAALTFDQEYAVEVLWHEINHNRQARVNIDALRKHPTAFDLAETVHQIISRETYPRLLATLGGEARNQAAIRAYGYGYQREVSNLHALLDAVDVDVPEILADLERVNFGGNLLRIDESLLKSIESVAGLMSPDRRILVRTALRSLLLDRADCDRLLARIKATA